MIRTLTIALGTSSFWPLAFIPALAAAMRRGVYKTPILPVFDWPIMALLIITFYQGLFSSQYALIWCASIWAIYVCQDAMPAPGRMRQWWPIISIVLIHSGIITFQYLALHIARVTGLQHNASILGMAGLAMFPYGAIVTGLSLSRTALPVAAMFGLLTKSRLILTASIFAIFLSITVGMFVTPDRYGMAGIMRDWHIRALAIDGTNDIEDSRISELLDVPTVERKWSIYGYGWTQYVPKTGKVAPHNMFVLSYWEMGILAVPFWLILFAMWWRYSGDIRLLLAVVIIGMFTVDLYSRIEGIYVVIGLHTVCTLYPLRNSERLSRYWHKLNRDFDRLIRTGEPPNREQLRDVYGQQNHG